MINAAANPCLELDETYSVSKLTRTNEVRPSINRANPISFNDLSLDVSSFFKLSIKLSKNKIAAMIKITTKTNPPISGIKTTLFKN